MGSAQLSGWMIVAGIVGAAVGTAFSRWLRRRRKRGQRSSRQYDRRRWR